MIQPEVISVPVNKAIQLLYIATDWPYASLLQYSLGLQGVAVDMADSQETALDQIKGGYCCDVFLISLASPKIDGYQVAQHLRALSCPQPMIGIIDSSHFQLDVKAGRAVNMHHYVSKSTATEEISRIIHESLK
ncbi:MAG: response regulator [Roseivirga sp.]